MPVHFRVAGVVISFRTGSRSHSHGSRTFENNRRSAGRIQSSSQVVGLVVFAFDVERTEVDRPIIGLHQIDTNAPVVQRQIDPELPACR